MNKISIIIAVISVVCSVLSLIFAILSSIKLKNINEIKKCWFNSKSTCERKIFDKIIRVLDFIFSLVSLILFFPIMMVIYLLLKSETNEAVITKTFVIGKKCNKVPIYSFRINESKESNLQSILKSTGLEYLPQLFNILKGDLAVYGLAKVKYDILDEAEKKDSNIKEPYNYYRPGFVSIAVFKKISEENYYDYLNKVNNEFLNNRSIRLLFIMVLYTFRLTLVPLNQEK